MQNQSNASLVDGLHGIKALDSFFYFLILLYLYAHVK